MVKNLRNEFLYLEEASRKIDKALEAIAQSRRPKAYQIVEGLKADLLNTIDKIARIEE